MASKVAQALTEQFYQWEICGRGWQVFEEPVWLEPYYEPFTRNIPHPTSFYDDGRKPSLLGSVFKTITSALDFDEEITPRISFTEPQVKGKPFGEDRPLRCYGVSLPKGEKVEVSKSLEFLLMLQSCRYPVSFEIVASYRDIRLQFVCREPDSIHLQAQLRTFFPNASIVETPEALRSICNRELPVFMVGLGLQEEFMRPLAVLEDLTLDPLTGLFGTLEHLQKGDTVTIQILFEPTYDSWGESIMRSVTDNTGGGFFANAPEMLPMAEEKVSSPFFATVIRVIAQSDAENKAQELVELVSGTFSLASQSVGNMLIPLVAYNRDSLVSDVLQRQSHRVGMHLNARELANFVHFPSPSVTSQKLVRERRKTKAVPDSLLHHPFVLGINSHQGKEVPVTISSEQRLKHTHIIGATGTGKSTLLLNLIVQDIEQNQGLAVLDPHGDLIEAILSHIPESRLQDVILIDPSDTEYSLGFNILTSHSEAEKEILASDLVSVFKRLSTSWGDQMNSVFANAILAFLESHEGGTLFDLRRFLIEKSFREDFLKTVTDPTITYYWQKQYPLLKSGSIGPILTRLDTFLRPKPIRYMVAQKRSLNFEEIMDSGKILLVKLSQGLIGDENSYLLGSLFVSKIYQTAMARQAKENRRDFWLYVDEFQNFVTPSMSAILSGARKYHLGLILAHQDMQQLVKQDTELASSVTSNAGTRICFRVGETDAKRFENGYSFFDAEDLQNLKTGEAVVRIDRPDMDFNLVILPLHKPDTELVEQTKELTVSFSRNKYGTPRSVVDELLLASLNTHFQTEGSIEKPNTKTPKPIVELPKAQIQSITLETNTNTSATIERLVKQKELSRHRYMQSLIKKMAEAQGYVAVIEKPLDNGGRVDVSLEKDGKRIACEVRSTTSAAWEVHNIQKCLGAGYDLVIVVVSDRKSTNEMLQQITNTLEKPQKDKVMVMKTNEVFNYLGSEGSKKKATEMRMKGYRIKIEYNTSDIPNKYL